MDRHARIQSRAMSLIAQLEQTRAELDTLQRYCDHPAGEQLADHCKLCGKGLNGETSPMQAAARYDETKTPDAPDYYAPAVMVRFADFTAADGEPIVVDEPASEERERYPDVFKACELIAAQLAEYAQCSRCSFWTPGPALGKWGTCNLVPAEPLAQLATHYCSAYTEDDNRCP